MAQVTIENVEEFNKIAKAHLQGGVAVVYFKDAPFAGEMKAGATVEMKTEERPSKNDPNKKDRWVVSVNGVDAVRARGGGGGFKATPRDEAIIVAQCLFKCAVDVAIHNANTDTKARQLDPNEVKALYQEFCVVFPSGHKTVKEACGA